MLQINKAVKLILMKTTPTISVIFGVYKRQSLWDIMNVNFYIYIYILQKKNDKSLINLIAYNEIII